MDNKTISIISYITIIGWVIAYLVGKDNLDSFSKYHLRQSLGLGLMAIGVSFIIGILRFMIPALGMITWIINLFFFVLFIVGIINAANGQKKPLPVIGKMFEDKFSFIG